MGRFRAKIQFSSAVVAHATFARREICEKDVHSHTNYGPCLAPNRMGKWDVFFLWRTLQIRISLHRAWVARKSTFLLKMLDLNKSYRYPEGHRAHLRVFMIFRARAPYLKAIRWGKMCGVCIWKPDQAFATWMRTEFRFKSLPSRKWSRSLNS